jgi:AMP-polyphosphate phosphotransferase
MFDTAELGRSLDKQAYDERVPALRAELLKRQVALSKANFSAIVLLHGLDTAGRGEIYNLLHAWLDARYLSTQAYEPATEEERQRPAYWRYWRWLPPRGRVAIFLGSWYTEPLLRRAYGESSEKAYIQALYRAAEFEKTLADDGTLFIKFWLHVTEREQARRLRERRYRQRKHAALHHERYEHFVRAASRMHRETSTAQVPWSVIEANDERYRNVSVAQHLIDRVGARLQITAAEPRIEPNPNIREPVTILDSLDLGKRLDRREYEERLASAQNELNRLGRKLQKRKRGAVFLFEGWDAAGKGGAIRRITQALDARQYRVIPTSAPSSEERAYHYLWRFWRDVPRIGRITIYDRSWYGRVLVERVESFARPAEWQRAYREINEFEEQLAGGRLTLVKFWLHIGKDEQLRRFNVRAAEPWKQYKLTPDDFRNRERSDDYEVAVNDMLGNTDTEYAPWTLVEAEDKHFARIKVLETICARLTRDL